MMIRVFPVLLFVVTIILPTTAFIPQPPCFHTSSSIIIATTRVYQERIPPPRERSAPQGGDMAYIEKNIQRQMNTYAAIRHVGGLDCIRDVYVRAPSQKTCWYVGKLAFVATVTPAQALLRQRNLIEEHATRLRPIELGRAFGRLDFYIAPGDSEGPVSRNEIPLHRIPQTTISDPNNNNNNNNNNKTQQNPCSLKDAGFLCEYVTNLGAGFCVERTPDGDLLPDFE